LTIGLSFPNAFVGNPDMCIIWIQFDFLSLRVHFLNGKNIYLVSVSEKLVLKFSGTSGLEHFRHLSAKSLEIPLQDKIFA